MNKSRSPLGQLMKLMDLVRRQIEKDNDPSAAPDAEDQAPMVSKLMKRGFRLEEIETAMKWLSLMSLTVSGNGAAGLSDGISAEKPSNDPAEVAKAGGVRQLHSSEAIRLTPEAQRHLLGVLERGEISSLHFERTIEYLWRHDLREVTPTRLELILYMNDPQTQGQTSSAASPTNMFSSKVNPPVFIN
ncbi:MAG TPA: DUF494 family protein [Candidatus Ozemobacteraceae bacterium]|nr:DUF494 family protein [Candidatus Ozemobacteraceae bacterium]